MTDTRFGLDATWWVLPSTPDAKYAHAPNWSVHSGDTPQKAPACGSLLPSWDPYDLPAAERHATGKPPCPKCVRRLRHHLTWLGEWVESYENLTWESEGLTQGGEKK